MPADGSSFAKPAFRFFDPQRALEAEIARINASVRLRRPGQASYPVNDGPGLIELANRAGARIGGDE